MSCSTAGCRTCFRGRIGHGLQTQTSFHGTPPRIISSSIYKLAIEGQILDTGFGRTGTLRSPARCTESSASFQDSDVTLRIGPSVVPSQLSPSATTVDSNDEFAIYLQDPQTDRVHTTLPMVFEDESTRLAPENAGRLDPLRFCHKTVISFEIVVAANRQNHQASQWVQSIFAESDVRDN